MPTTAKGNMPAMRIIAMAVKAPGMAPGMATGMATGMGMGTMARCTTGSGWPGPVR